MAKIKRFTTADGGYHGELGFYCPGCKQEHFIFDNETNPEASRGYCWQFNKDFENPTIKPSVLVQRQGHNGNHNTLNRCHSFITDGKIEFLSDCTHELAGKTVELPNVDQWPE
jgi:hypothetical protein